MKTVYEINGYRNREHYLRCLAEDYNVDEDTVETMANLLGPNEDFDGLVVMVQDIADGDYYD